MAQATLMQSIAWQKLLLDGINVPYLWCVVVFTA